MLHTNQHTQRVTWLVTKGALVPADGAVAPVPSDPARGGSEPLRLFFTWPGMTELKRAQDAKDKEFSCFHLWQPTQYLAHFLQGNLQIAVALCFPSLFLLLLPQFNDKDA